MLEFFQIFFHVIYLLFPYSIWTFISFFFLDFFLPLVFLLATCVLFWILFLYFDLRGSTELDKKD